MPAPIAPRPANPTLSIALSIRRQYPARLLVDTDDAVTTSTPNRPAHAKRRYRAGNPVMQNFELTSRRDEERLRVKLAGEVDMAASLVLEPQVERLLDADDVRRLELDLGDVRFIDSAGVGTLLALRERANRLGIETELVDASPPVRRILDITGTGGAFSG
jgi:anti-sigma B factor antagonist